MRARSAMRRRTRPVRRTPPPRRPRSAGRQPRKGPRFGRGAEKPAFSLHSAGRPGELAAGTEVNETGVREETLRVSIDDEMQQWYFQRFHCQTIALSKETSCRREARAGGVLREAP